MAVQMKSKPSPACRITKLLLGQILIDGEFITPATLHAAMEMQKSAHEPLGEVLLRIGALNAVDLKEVLSLQKNLASFEFPRGAAAGVRKLLSDLFSQAGRRPANGAEGAVKDQHEAFEKIGEILVRSGWVRKNVVNVVLAYQSHRGGISPVPGRCRLGEILVATEQITREQLNEALTRQKNSKKATSALLIKAGCLQPPQDEYSLNLHQKLAAVAIIAALGTVNSVLENEACAGSPQGSTSQKLMVTAVVFEHTSMTVLNQVQQVVVTSGDIARGYVDVTAASRISVKSNDPRGYVLMFEVMGDSASLFDSVSVVMGGREVLLSTSGGWIPQPYVRGGLTMELSYRFVLSQKAQPGTYAWPFSITASPL